MKKKYTQKYNDELPKFDRGVSWLCWAYNEQELIREYLIKADALLKQTVKDYEIVVIDDCSTDETNAIVRSLMDEIPQIRLIRNDVNMNVGYSSRRAIRSAQKEYLFWQTIDWSYDIKYLRIFLELLKSHDIVAGVRREPVKAADAVLKPFFGLFKLFGIRHITRRSDTVTKAFISVVNYILIRMLFNVPLSDYQNIVFYPTRWIQSIDYEARSSFANPEGLIKSYWNSKSIIEVPISFIPRKKGIARGTRPSAIINSITDIIRLWFKWVLLRGRGNVVKGNIQRLNPEEWEISKVR